MASLQAWLQETWVLLLDSGPLFVLGLLLAGVISVFVRSEQIKAFIGEGKTAALSWRFGRCSVTALFLLDPALSKNLNSLPSFHWLRCGCCAESTSFLA